MPPMPIPSQGTIGNTRVVNLSFDYPMKISPVVKVAHVFLKN